MLDRARNAKAARERRGEEKVKKRTVCAYTRASSTRGIVGARVEPATC